jgi:hypothetical protein
VAAAESLGKKMSAGWQTDKVRLLVDTLERLPIDWVARVLLLEQHRDPVFRLRDLVHHRLDIAGY